MRTPFKNRIFLTLFSALIAVSGIMTSPAQARIDIVPQKIVVESRDRSGELTILNLFKEPSTFRMDIVHYAQDENGAYKKLNAPLNPAFDPASIVRFSPRQFTLQPGGRQKVRLSIRKPANLPEGEYRFHIKSLRVAQPNLDNLDDGIYMHANIGVTIPVIIRHGNTSATAKISNARIVEPARTAAGKTELQFTLNREGNASTVGEAKVLWQPANGKQILIGELNHLNVFTEVNTRNVKIPLDNLPYGAGTITVRYQHAQGKNKGEIYDEVSFAR